MTLGPPDRTLRRFSGYTMKRAFNAIQADLNTALAESGLRMVTFSALTVICDTPGLRQSDLARVLMIERPNLVAIVDELEKRGLIARKPDPDDRRAIALAATDEGHRVQARAQVQVDAHEQRMTKGLSAEDQAVLNRLLRAIEDNG